MVRSARVARPARGVLQQALGKPDYDGSMAPPPDPAPYLPDRTEADRRQDGIKTERYWMPESFVWFGCESRRVGSKQEPCIFVGKNYIRISTAAAELLGLDAGDRIAVGKTVAYLAVRKGENGIIARDDARTRKTRAVQIAATAIVNALREEGWPVPYRYPCVLDARSNMLVAKKPCPDKPKGAQT